MRRVERRSICFEASRLCASALVALWTCASACAPPEETVAFLVDGDTCSVEETITAAANPAFHTLTVSDNRTIIIENLELSFATGSDTGCRIFAPVSSDSGARYGVSVSTDNPQITCLLIFSDAAAEIERCERRVIGE